MVNLAAQAQSQAGDQAGDHGGAGAGGHGDAAGQAGTTGTGASTSAQATDSQPASVFSLATDTTSTDARSQAVAQLSALVRTPVQLQDAADAVRATFTAASQAGVAQARLSLSPESLGGIRISLSQTSQGLIATVAADHPEAAQTLQQSAGELRRSLEASGMQLLRLDIGSTGQQALGSGGGSQQNGSSAGSSWANGGAADSDADGADDTDATSTPNELTVALASGALVNVLA